MSRASLVLAASLGLVACARHPAAPASPSGPPAQLASTAAGSDDVIVARVNGRPVWGSCVAAEAAGPEMEGSGPVPGPGAARQAALDACIAFELLAQQAEARGLATDPEVVDATRTALVGQLVAHEFEDGITRPEQIGPTWNRVAAHMRPALSHDEARGSTYVRVVVAPKATPADDAAAHAVADRIAAAVNAAPGLTSPDFVALALQAAAGQKIQHGDVLPNLRGWFTPPYGDALFALPELGATSPAVRTKWGWDVILYTSQLPATHPSEDALVRDMMPEAKHAYFRAWVEQIRRALGVRVQRFPDHIAALGSLP